MRKAISFFTIVVFIMISNVHSNADETQSITSVLDAAWEEFGFIGFGIGETDPTISIVMDDTKSEQALRKYLEENLMKSDLDYYNIEILKRNLQEVKQEHFLYLIDDATRHLPQNMIFYI